MSKAAIEALMQDWERHVAQACAGNPRASFAAWEVLERLERLGADPRWLSQAKESCPAAFTSWEINDDKENAHGQ